MVTEIVYGYSYVEEILGMERRERIRFFSFYYFSFMNGSALVRQLR